MASRRASVQPPWIERRKVEDAIEVLENGDRDWDGLDGEERHGTVLEALHILTEVSDGE